MNLVDYKAGKAYAYQRTIEIVRAHKIDPAGDERTIGRNLALMAVESELEPLLEDAVSE